ncbi:dephospho-CoA kinase [Nematocida displodere]|uniref:Dephospho-CoA kinase n=1 Tax=Nematocida displodere TaxID=1805483 RepID=A0A177ECI1_9MICR|nr:dephospho-CoA kinase [Nematocida displodere]
MKTIAVTGGRATGKTTALEYIRNQGYATLSLEDSLTDLLEDTKTQIRLSHASIPRTSTGTDAGKVEKRLNHPDPTKVKDILIPQLRHKLSVSLHLHTFLGKGTLFVEVPFLYECSMEKYFDKVLVVTCGPKTQEERIQDPVYGKDPALSQAIAQDQLPLQEKRKKCDIVIDNNKVVDEMEAQLDAFLSGERKYSFFYFFTVVAILASVLLPFSLSPNQTNLARHYLGAFRDKCLLLITRVKAWSVFRSWL